MLKKGMTYEEVMEMVKAMGWKIEEEKNCEEYGEEWIEMTILQDDHGVFIQLDEEGIYEIQFVPAWALN